MLARGLAGEGGGCGKGELPPPEDIDGYGEPVPCDGIKRDGVVWLAPYVGTSLSMRSSGTLLPHWWGKGDGDGVEVCLLFRSELFDRAEEER